MSNTKAKELPGTRKINDWKYDIYLRFPHKTEDGGFGLGPPANSVFGAVPICFLRLRVPLVDILLTYSAYLRARYTFYYIIRALCVRHMCRRQITPVSVRLSFCFRADRISRARFFFNETTRFRYGAYACFRIYYMHAIFRDVCPNRYVCASGKSCGTCRWKISRFVFRGGVTSKTQSLNGLGHTYTSFAFCELRLEYLFNEIIFNTR